MTIKAVVLDIGGVLEIIDDSIFPGPWPARLGLTEAEFAERLDGPGSEAARDDVRACKQTTGAALQGKQYHEHTFVGHVDTILQYDL